jgi:hypothetical protein
MMEKEAPTLTSTTGLVTGINATPSGDIHSTIKTAVSEKEYENTLCKLEDAYRKIDELKDVIVELNIQLVRFKKQSEEEE